MQSPEGRSNSKEFLILTVKKLGSDAGLKKLPMVLHVHEARKTKEEAASQCISTLKMASCPQQPKNYLHCFCSFVSVANFWINAFPYVKFGVSPKNISSNQPSAAFFANCDLKYVVLETHAPSLHMSPLTITGQRMITSRPRHPSLSRRSACEVLQAAAYIYKEFYCKFSVPVS